jgi:GT2 family glycosyltransferase
MLDLSIIVVSWNARVFLRQCLTSIAATADRERSEVIVVDNASGDGSWEMVQEHFPDVVLIRNASNVGFAKACNIGIRLSRGKYVALVNSDVEILEGCLTRLVTYLNENPQVGMIGPRIVGRDRVMQRSCMGFPTIWNTLCAALALPSLFPRSSLFGGWLLSNRSFDHVQTVDILNGMFVITRRRALDQVGLLDEDFFMYGEDMDWCRRFWAGDWPIVFYPQAVAIHYGGASSANAPVRFYVEMNRSLLKYFKKHQGWVGHQALCGVIAIHQFVRVVANAAVYLIRPTSRTECSAKIKRSAACLLWLAGFLHAPEDRRFSSGSSEAKG